MVAQRVLLPFTHGVNESAIDHALRFAGASHMTLVTVALIPLPKTRSGDGVRLEHIQQAKDFFELIRVKAARYEVAVEQYEQITNNVLESIKSVARQRDCQGLLMMAGGKGMYFLAVEETQQIKQHVDLPLYVLHFPIKKV